MIIRNLYSIFWTAGLCLSLFACSEDEASVFPEEPDTSAGLSFHLSVKGTEEAETVLDGEVHWLVFNEDDCLTEYLHSSSIDELNDSYRPAMPGRYLYILVASMDKDLLPSHLPMGMPVADAFRMLESVQAADSDMLTGWRRVVVEEDSLNICTIRVGQKPIAPSWVRLYLRLPEALAVQTRNTGNRLRCVTEVYDPESGQCVVHRAFFPTVGADAKTFEVTLDNLEQLDYDLLYWTDYVPGSEPDEDHCYLTSSLKAVVLSSDVPYVAGDVGRRAYYLHAQADLSQQGSVQQAVTMNSPFASYTVIGADQQKYEGMQGVNDLPGWEDIEVQGTYNGYFPCAFNVWDGVPVDARAGQTFTAQARQAPEGEIILFSDYIFADGDQASFTSVSFALVDKRTGEPFSQVDDVIVDYMPGEETTVSGDYLTAGAFSGDMNVDDRWEGELDVEF